MNAYQGEASGLRTGSLTPPLPLPVRLEPFERRFAAEMVGWIATDDELRWVAPSTRRPLTAAKIAAWKRPEGEAFVMMRDGDPRPVGYGELNPMRHDPDRWWLGHIIVRPDQRGRRLGEALVRLLVEQAFERHLASRIVLVVFPDNEGAAACYRRAGFRYEGEEYHQFAGWVPRQKLLRFELGSQDWQDGRP